MWIRQTAQPHPPVAYEVVRPKTASPGQAEEQDLPPRPSRRPDDGQRPARVVVQPRPSEHRQLVQILVLDRPARDQPALREEDGHRARPCSRRRERADVLGVPDRRRPDSLVEQILTHDLGVADSPTRGSYVNSDPARLPARDPNRRRPRPCRRARVPRVQQPRTSDTKSDDEHIEQPTHPPLLSPCAGIPPLAATGSSIQKIEPFPVSLSKFNRPPWASTTDRAIVKPRPLPGIPLAPASPRKNFANTRSCRSSGIPSPSSRTLTRTSPSSRSATTCTVPPSGEYLIAFERRFPTTCARRFGSP